MPTQLLLSPGRIVEGNVHTPSDIGMNGQKKAKPEYYFAVAIPKTDPRIPEIWAAYQQEALGGYGNNAAIKARIMQGITPNGFAFKIADGDAPDRRERAGQAGCWIFKIKTTWPIRVLDNQNQAIEPSVLQSGFWCDVMVNLAPNGKQDHTAGLYVNPIYARWLFPGYGERILGGPPPSVMGAAPSQLPPGAMPSASPAPSAAPHPAPGGGHAPATPHAGGGMAPNVPAMGSPAQTPQGWQQPAPQASTAPQPQQVLLGYDQAGNAVYGPPPAGHVSGPHTTSAPTALNVQPATAYPSNPPQGQPGGPANAPAAMAPAMPAGAHSMQAQPGSMTASPISGFAHGNPAS